MPPLPVRLLSVDTARRQEPMMALPAMAAALPALLKTLEKWADWEKIRSAPSRIDQLEARIAELERKLDDLRDRRR